MLGDLLEAPGVLAALLARFPMEKCFSKQVHAPYVTLFKCPRSHDNLNGIGIYD